MSLSLFRRPSPAPTRRPRTTRARFALESLEDRVVMSTAAITPHVMPAVHVAVATQTTVGVPINISNVTLTGLTKNAANKITGVTGTVSGTIDGIAFSKAPITIAAGAASTTSGSGAVKAAATVPVLALHLGPINLNLLGLQVKTSEICLNITAQTGPGNLLGNLVGQVANLLNGVAAAPNGTGPTRNLLNSLTAVLNKTATGSPATSSSSIVGLLNSALSQGLSAMTPAATAAATPTVTNILHLTLAPVDLTVLGLNVHLDNCAGGPVTVDVNAISGNGNLLGNLLTGLANLLNGSSLAGTLAQLDNNILNLIKGL